jgi:signal transduction histidine kinase
MNDYDPDDAFDLDDPEEGPDGSDGWDDGWPPGAPPPFTGEGGEGDAAAGPPPEAGELAGIRAVVVEEDPVDRRLLQGCLDFLGCDSVTSRSAEEAVARLAEAPRDLVLADASLPGMAGGRTVAALRRAARAAAPSRGGDLVVVAVAEGMDVDREEELRAAGFDACLGKPAELGRVGELLRGLVGPGSGHDPGAEGDGREITTELRLSAEEEARVELHTFLNVLNLLSGQLQLLRGDLGGGDVLAGSRERAERLLETVRSGAAGEGLSAALTELEDTLREETEAALAAADPGEAVGVDPSSAREVLGNALGILEVAHARAAERTRHVDRGLAWVDHSARGLTEDVMAFLAAVQRNARERYHIVHDPAAQEEGDYLVRLTIRGDGGDTLRMPPVLADVFRDLVANARKYTPPGGVLSAELVRSADELRLVVADSGMGIPEEEVERVVELGYRATNARSRDSWGGGFGLTKAYSVARALGGRLWIDSEPGRGTRVTVRIPVPEEESE